MHSLRGLGGCLCTFLVAVATIGLVDSSQARADEPSSSWTHCQQVVSDLKAYPPRAPLVVLFGGSRARECTVSDQHWTAQLRSECGMPVTARNLSSRNQTFEETRRLVRHLPTTATYVLIGVDEGRFAKQDVSQTVRLPLPEAGPITPFYRQHQYDDSGVLSRHRKQELVEAWLNESDDSGYSRFKRHRAANRKALVRLIETCQARGLHPVLVATPWNAEIIGARFNAARRAWRSDCEDLARDHGIPFVDPGMRVQLTSRDFYDLFHLVEPGRSAWQARLSALVCRSLRDHAAESETRPISGLAIDAPDLKTRSSG